MFAGSGRDHGIALIPVSKGSPNTTPSPDSLQTSLVLALRNGVFPAISVNKMSRSSLIPARQYELVSPKGTQQGEYL